MSKLTEIEEVELKVLINTMPLSEKDMRKYTANVLDYVAEKKKEWQEEAYKKGYIKAGIDNINNKLD